MNLQVLYSKHINQSSGAESYRLRKILIKYTAENINSYSYKELKNKQTIEHNQNREFSKKEKVILKTDKHCAKYLVSLFIKEIQSKITMRFYFTPVRIPVIMKSNENRYR